MAFLTWLHNWQLATPFGLFLSTPLAFACFVLFIWSFGPALKLRVGRPMVWWSRLIWILTLIPTVTGIILAAGGGKVPSAVATTNATFIQNCINAGARVVGSVTRFCLTPDPQRNVEHMMYSGLVVISLIIFEVLLRGNLIKHKLGLRFLPLVGFFLWGCAFMIHRVAVLPGASVGS